MRRWSRGPALITQLIALPVGYVMVQNGGALLAAGAGVMAVGAGRGGPAGHPAAADALGIRRTA